MNGSTLILLMAMFGQLPGAESPAIPRPVVTKPGMSPFKQWLVVNSPIDGHPTQVLGWSEGGRVCYDPNDYPQFATAPATLAEAQAQARATSAVGHYPLSTPTGVIGSKFPHVSTGQTWTGGNTTRPIGEGPMKAAKPEVFVTIIGGKRECKKVRDNLTRDPGFNELAREMGDRLAVESYDPSNPLVNDVGLPAGGKPDIVVLDSTGKEMGRWYEEPSATEVAEAVRKADPTYRPGGRSNPSSKEGIGLGWIAAGVVAIGLILYSRKGTAPQ